MPLPWLYSNSVKPYSQTIPPGPSSTPNSGISFVRPLHERFLINFSR